MQIRVKAEAAILAVKWKCVNVDPAGTDHSDRLVILHETIIRQITVRHEGS